MPRFFPTGAIAILSRDPFDATRTVFQDCSHADPVDEACAVVLSDGTVLAPRAKVSTCAGGGGVAAWEDFLGGPLVVRDSRGRAWPDAGLHRGCSPDGAYALKVARNSYGPWDVIEPDGSRWRLTDGDAHDIQLLGARQAIWMIQNAHYATPGLPIVFPTELTYGGRAAFIPEEHRYVLAYQRQSDGAFVCDGHIVLPPSDQYFSADIEYRDGRVRLTWSPSQADVNPQLLELTLAEIHAQPPSVPPDPTPIPPEPGPKPPDPTPKPPDPPKPKPPEPVYLHSHRKARPMNLDNKIVVLRGPAGKLGRPDAPNTGTWGDIGQGWRGMIWDGADIHDARYHHRAKSVENLNYALIHEQNHGLAGVDATKHSGDIGQQFYYKPDGNGDRGAYETWCIYDGNQNGALEAQVEYSNDEGKYFSCPCAIEVVG
jgi:hypothetical protein